MQTNPFTVQTPEDIPAQEACDLFVPVFSDFPKILGSGHVFLNGPRGCGKSMIFRFLQPDCQLIDKNATKLSDLNFFSVYVPLKNCDLKLTELKRLEGQHASVIINEHFMVLYIAGKVFSALSDLTINIKSKDDYQSVKEFSETFVPYLLEKCGYTGKDFNDLNCQSVSNYFDRLKLIINSLYSEVVSYLKKLSFSKEIFLFNGPLCGYLDFLFPLLKKINQFKFMPGPNNPLYLLIDDADNLNITQTKVLNSWVASRTSRVVSIKISTTQLQYKTYRTINGQSIDTPHDYSEINISAVYTSHKKRYRERIQEILRRRLDFFKFKTTSPEEFFPYDNDQEKRIDTIAQNIRDNWESKGKGYRANDDAYRYARPNYMKSLAGTSKSSSTYSYSGFNQLVHISSGIIRNFLDAAAQMFSECQADNSSSSIILIPPSIQNEVVRRQAAEFLFGDLEKMRDDEADDSPDEALVSMLNNLVRSMGGIFREILLSERSERRVFSFALYDEMNQQQREVMQLGIRYGYFHESSIGNKDGTGKTRLYILSRKLAPLFNLDPTSFAGYLFLQGSILDEAMKNSDKFVRTMQKRIHDLTNKEEIFEERQLKLFD